MSTKTNPQDFIGQNLFVVSDHGSIIPIKVVDVTIRHALKFTTELDIDTFRKELSLGEESNVDWIIDQHEDFHTIHEIYANERPDEKDFIFRNKEFAIQYARKLMDEKIKTKENELKQLEAKKQYLHSLSF